MVVWKSPSGMTGAISKRRNLEVLTERDFSPLSSKPGAFAGSPSFISTLKDETVQREKQRRRSRLKSQKSSQSSRHTA